MAETEAPVDITWRAEDDIDKPQVLLLGRDGSTPVIIGACRKAARKAGWSEKEIGVLSAEFLSGDYDHVLQTALRYFDID